METQTDPRAIMILFLILFIASIAIGIAITRWVLRINTMVDNQEKQLRTQEELVVQNEKIIKLLQRIAGGSEQNQI